MWRALSKNVGSCSGVFIPGANAIVHRVELEAVEKERRVCPSQT